MKSLTTTSTDFLKKLSVILFLITFTITSSNGQGGTVSPYSRYGLGDLQFGGFASQLSMGGIAAGIKNQYHLNYSNPASYAALRFTTFETAVNAQLVSFETQQAKSHSNSANLSYLAIGFPVIREKWGASVGLIPFSDIGYDIRDEANIPQVGRVNYLFQGTGGINRFYIGTGFNVIKNLSFGINASYLFGTLQRTRKVEFPDQLYYFNTQSNVSTNIHDIYLNYGLQYTLQLGKEKQLILGASGALASKVKSTNDLLTFNYVINSAGLFSTKDTIEEISDQKGTTTLPVSWSGGAVFKKSERWTVGIDYTFQNWSKFKSFGANDSLNDSYRISAGGQFVPDYASLRFYKRIQYRAGFRYAQTYLRLKDTPLNEYALSVGFGFPLKIKSPPRVLPVISFTVEAGQRGTTSNNLLQEQFVRFHLGITISEEWFMKRKFD